MLDIFFTGVEGPGARFSKPRRPGKACAALVVVAARVGKRPSANTAQGMAQELDLLPATGAKILRITSDNSRTAGATTRWIKPVD